MNRYYVHNDHLGTPQSVTNDSGQEVWRADYRPFGEPTINADVDGDANLLVMNVRFPGQYYDAESGNHYNYFRDYNPGLGRYVQSDPIGLDGGMNTYLYALANPVRYFDPDGAMPCEQFDYACKQSRAQQGRRHFPGGANHYYRNKHNSCPKKEPSNSVDRLGNKWVSDDFSSQYYHGGFNTYRGMGDKLGSQCVYNECGELIDEGKYMGTFDYSSPRKEEGSVDILGTVQHWAEDVAPHSPSDNDYAPNQTHTY